MSVTSARRVEGMVLFEVYESNGNLLSVSSILDHTKLDPTDTIVRRPWATSAAPEEVRR